MRPDLTKFIGPLVKVFSLLATVSATVLALGALLRPVAHSIQNEAISSVVKLVMNSDLVFVWAAFVYFAARFASKGLLRFYMLWRSGHKYELARAGADLPYSIIPNIVSVNGNGGEQEMDFTSFIGLVASFADIFGFLQNNKVIPTADTLAKEFERRRYIKGSVESGLNVDGEQIRRIALQYMALSDRDARFADRIREKCLPPYYNKIKSADDIELEDLQADARRCVCHSLSMVKDHNGGKLPSDEFKDWWREFNCKALSSG